MNHALPSAYDFLPHSIEAEQQLLGAVLMSNSVWDSCNELVEQEHFFEPIHAKLWLLISDRLSAGQSTTPVTLMAQLGADGYVELAGMTVGAYIAHLASEAVTLIHAPHHARMVRDLWARRRIISLTRELQARAMGMDGSDVDALLDDADADLSAIRFGKTFDGVVTMAEAMKTSIDQTAKAYQGGVSIGLSFGIAAIDEMLGPMLPGHLITILGASGHGKTGLVAQALKNIAEPSLDSHQNGRRGLFFSMEMDGAEIARRILAADTGFTTRAQKSGEVNTAEFEILSDSARRLSSLPIIFDQTPGQTVTKIVRKARALKKRYPDIAVIAIDHVLEIKAESPRWSQVQTVENAVQELKRLAKELQVVVILLAQATREGQKRDHWRLRTTDIWGGDRIKQSSDAVLALGIPSVWLSEREPESSDRAAYDKWMQQCLQWSGKAEIGAPKVRDGESGRWKTVAFDGRKMHFSDV